MGKIKKGIIMFGLGDFADVVSYVIENKMGEHIQAYTLNECYVSQREVKGKEVVPFEHLQEIYSPEDYCIVLGFIGKKMFDQRSAVFSQIKEKGYELPNIIHTKAAIDSENIGEGNIILQNVSIEHHCKIGSGNIIWPNVVMPHHNIVGDFNNLAPSVSFSGYSSVGDHCFIGNNTCINNHVHIHSYAYIGAGAYVAKNVEKNRVLVPNRSYYLENKTGFDFL